MRSMFNCAAAVMTVLAAVSCNWDNERYYERSLRFPEGISADEKLALAAMVVPDERQLQWQSLELTAFLHFGMNTFTGNEWGSGKDSPELFNPVHLDCRQWVRTLSEAGFRMAIITAKHHDGFCLWPTSTTEYCVRNSPWKGGCGDVVRELREACSEYGMGFGVYLSPWDRNARCYGDSPEYNKLYIRQLTELLTDYGKVDEVWFDGACGEGPDGRRQEYDWKSILTTVRALQPDAVTAIMGDDVRWVGNEGGVGRETEWSATVFAPESYERAAAQNKKLGLHAMSKDLGSRELLAQAEEVFWYPSEVDVSIRPGWFYHSDQDSQVRSLENLVDIYYKSVGRNSVLLLNVPPDHRGLIHEVDSMRLRAFGQYVAMAFSDNLLAAGQRRWTPGPGESREFKVRPDAAFNTFMIREDISKGQRVESFMVEALVDGVWSRIAEGTTAGYKRLLRFGDMRADRIRVTIDSVRGRADIIEVGLFCAPDASAVEEIMK